MLCALPKQKRFYCLVPRSALALNHITWKLEHTRRWSTQKTSPLKQGCSLPRTEIMSPALSRHFNAGVVIAKDDISKPPRDRFALRFDVAIRRVSVSLVRRRVVAVAPRAYYVVSVAEWVDRKQNAVPSPIDELPSRSSPSTPPLALDTFNNGRRVFLLPVLHRRSFIPERPGFDGARPPTAEVAPRSRVVCSGELGYADLLDFAVTTAGSSAV